MELIKRAGVWVRAECEAADLVIVRDIILDDAYRLKIIPGIVKEAQVVVDVGAHIGCFALAFHERNPTARIICVEANPANWEALEANVGSFATIVRGACSYQGGELQVWSTVYPGTENSGGSMVQPLSSIVEREPYRDAGLVGGWTLEQMGEVYAFGQIDLLKLDCEGSEFDILRSTPSLNKVRFVVGEYHGRRDWDALRAEVFGRGWDYGQMHDGGESGGLFHYSNLRWPPAQEETHTGRLTVGVPEGIGDCLWAMTKARALMEYHCTDVLDVAILGNSDRAVSFLTGFDFVDRVYNTGVPVLNGDPDPDGRLTYLVSGRCHANSGPLETVDWLLIPNGHLERGRLLEDWLPQFATDWGLMQHFRLSMSAFIGLRDMQTIKNWNHDVGHVVCYLGPAEGNAIDGRGHNRGSVWSTGDWRLLFRGIIAAGLQPVVIGAGCDESYASLVLEGLGTDLVVNFVGQTSVAQALMLVAGARAVVGYQGGLAIAAPYLGVPSCVFWRPDGDSIAPDQKVCFHEGMASGWIPPSMRGVCLPAIYTRTRVEDVLAWLRGLPV